MDGTFYYYILKNYVGSVNKKHKNNTHLFFIPVEPKKYMYVILIGKLEDKENTFASQLLVRLDEELLDGLINGEMEHFGDRFVEIESRECKSLAQAPGKYLITFPKKGINILSDLEVEYQLEYSSQSRKIYTINGNLNLVTGEINDQDLGMVAAKQMAFMGNRKRFEEVKKIHELRGKWYYD